MMVQILKDRNLRKEVQGEACSRSGGRSQVVRVRKPNHKGKLGSYVPEVRVLNDVTQD